MICPKLVRHVMYVVTHTMYNKHTKDTHPSLNSVFSQSTLVHILVPTFIKINFNIIF